MGSVTKQASTRFSIVKRSKGQSAVEKASYISRSILVSEYDGQTYRPKTGSSYLPLSSLRSKSAVMQE